MIDVVLGGFVMGLTVLLLILLNTGTVYAPVEKRVGQHTKLRGFMIPDIKLAESEDPEGEYAEGVEDVESFISIINSDEKEVYTEIYDIQFNDPEYSKPVTIGSPEELVELEGQHFIYDFLVAFKESDECPDWLREKGWTAILVTDVPFRRRFA